MKYIRTLITILVPGLFALLISGNAAACSSSSGCGCTTPSSGGGGSTSCTPVTNASWNFSGYSSGMTMTLSGSSGAPSVTATGWSNSNHVWDANDSNYGTGNLVQREIVQYGTSGLGVTSYEDVNQGSPYHAMDNNRRIDSILLNFGGTAVTMNQIKFGWASGDSDFSLAAYTGAGTPASLAGLEYSDLASNGWTIIGSYLGDGPVYSTDVNGGDISSSYWLISALNPDLGGPNSMGYYNNDYFKLGLVAGDITCPPPATVPEPTIMLLLGSVMLISLLRSRAHRNGQSDGTLQA